MKWGEYSNDIQFILRRSDSGPSQKPPLPANNSKSPIGNGFVTFKLFINHLKPPNIMHYLPKHLNNLKQNPSLV